MNTWDEFESEAKLVENETRSKEPKVVLLLQDSIGLIATGFTVAAVPDTLDATKARMSLLSHNLETLKCSVDTALRGYYVQSLNLLRIVYENWVAYHYLVKNPQEAHFWLVRKKNKQPPGHAAMLKKLDNDFNPLKSNMKGWYGTLCGFAHTDPINLLPNISTESFVNEISIYFGAKFKPELFKASSYAICLWAGVMLSTISSWIPKENNWQSEMTKIEDQIIEFIDQENASFKSGIT